MRFTAEVQTMVLIDLVGYSDTAAMLEETLGVKALGELNAGIQNLLDEALNADGRSRSDHVVMTTGDGALLRFSKADQALTFANGLHAASVRHNLNRISAASQRLFRVGIGTGDVAFDTEATQGNGLAGMAIARAARLEARADPGGTLIDTETWAAASPSLSSSYAGPETIAGKRDERLSAYRARSVGTLVAPVTHTSHPTRDQSRALVGLIIKEMGRTTRAIQVTLLVRKLQIPFDEQPADTLPIDRRLVEILEWADREHQLGEMLSDLRGLLGNAS